MSKLKSFLQRPCSFILILFLFLECLPASGEDAAALRLYEHYNRSGDNMTYYVLQPDGDLISWGGDPGKLYSGPYLYSMRQKIARNVTSFTCISYAVLYVDEEHVLWGNGSDPQILQSEERRQVRIMKDVQEIAANDYYALALKTDGTVWAWPGLDVTKYNQQHGLEPSVSTPVQIAEDMRSIFEVNDSFYALTKENVLVYLSPSGDEPIPIAENSEAISLFYLPRTTCQYLTRQGEVYIFEAYPFNTNSSMKIADQVHSLCKNGLLKEDHSLWTWKGPYPEEGLVKIRNGVRSAASPTFYADTLGRLHWQATEYKFSRHSRSIRWLDPTARNKEMLFLCLAFLLRKLYQRFEKNIPRRRRKQCP